MRHLEPLEGRTLFASYAASTVSQLISAINSANSSAVADTITLAAGAIFSLTAVDNTTDPDGPNGLPVITAEGGELTIAGNGATIERSTEAGTPTFRLLNVDFDAVLTLSDLTLQGGYATAQSGRARGGAIFAIGGPSGFLHLQNVIVQNNSAVGADGRVVFGFSVIGQSADGGGIAAGTFTAVGCTIRNNLAQGGRGGENSTTAARHGQSARGGGIFGEGNMTDCLIVGNTARGGDASGGIGGTAVGGGAYLFGGELRTVTITENAAIAGVGVSRKAAGEGYGGGIYGAFLDTVGLDAFTIRNAKHNTASDIPRNIAGSYFKLV